MTDEAKPHELPPNTATLTRDRLAFASRLLARAFDFHSHPVGAMLGLEAKGVTF
jgi:hypothetical protein